MPIIRRTLAGLAVVALAAGAADAQRTVYPQTLYWGAGLIDIPVAYVSPLTGDFAISYSALNMENDPGEPKINYSDAWNSQFTASVALFGRLELGYAAYSSNPEFGFFGRALLLDGDALMERAGATRWLPSVAVGVRNVGPYDHIDRFGAGYQLLPPTEGHPAARHVVDSVHRDFDTGNTVYGVATKHFALSDIRASWPNVGISLSVGYGNGLFQDDGGLGDQYAEFPTGGLFYGAKVDLNAYRNVIVSLMAENNAWDYNFGATMRWRGLVGGVYYTQAFAESGPHDPASRREYVLNEPHFGLTIGWHSNIFALLQGDFLQDYAARLEEQRRQLLAEIGARQQRIAGLQLEINRYEAQNLLELEQRRAQAQAELREEREALRRLEERLRRIEEQQRQTPPR